MIASRFTTALAVAFSFASIASAAPTAAAPAVEERGLLGGLLGGLTGSSSSSAVSPLLNILTGLQTSTGALVAQVEGIVSSTGLTTATGTSSLLDLDSLLSTATGQIEALTSSGLDISKVSTQAQSALNGVLSNVETVLGSVTDIDGLSDPLALVNTDLTGLLGNLPTTLLKLVTSALSTVEGLLSGLGLDGILGGLLGGSNGGLLGGLLGGLSL